MVEPDISEYRLLHRNHPTPRAPNGQRPNLTHHHQCTFTFLSSDTHDILYRTSRVFETFNSLRQDLCHLCSSTRQSNSPPLRLHLSASSLSNSSHPASYIFSHHYFHQSPPLTRSSDPNFAIASATSKTGFHSALTASHSWHTDLKSSNLSKIRFRLRSGHTRHAFHDRPVSNSICPGNSNPTYALSYSAISSNQRSVLFQNIRDSTPTSPTQLLTPEIQRTPHSHSRIHPILKPKHLVSLPSVLFLQASNSLLSIRKWNDYFIIINQSVNHSSNSNY